MKTQMITLILILTLSTAAFSQEKSEERCSPVIYSFFINSVPDGFNFPLIGFINMGWGSHNSAHIGFINTARRNLNGGQIGFVNFAGGNVFGTQIGYINTAGRAMTGAQIGFVNTAIRKTNAIQLGFVNTSADSLKGAQIGFVNTASRRAEAAQVGYVNATKSLKGVQIGFVNYADTIESGMPIGFLSIVRRGGYHALELSVTEMYPINLSYKIGVSKLYSTLNLSYNPSNEKSVAIGAGLGSVLPMGNKFCFNPEFVSQSLIFDGFQQTTTFAANFGYRITPKITALAGPSLVWQYGNTFDRLNKPFFSFLNQQVGSWGNLITGARLSVRYQF
jgi:hypothetical protein